MMDRGSSLWGRLFSVMFALILVSCASPGTEPRPPSDTTRTGVPEAAFLAPARPTIRVVSFNIKFLGHYRARANAQLADMLAGYDLVLVQELVAPPAP